MKTFELQFISNISLLKLWITLLRKRGRLVFLLSFRCHKFQVIRFYQWVLYYCESQIFLNFIVVNEHTYTYTCTKKLIDTLKRHTEIHAIWLHHTDQVHFDSVNFLLFVFIALYLFDHSHKTIVWKFGH